MIDETKKTYFEQLDKLDKRQKVLFRRTIGQMVKDTSSDVMLQFYQILPSFVKQTDENKWFLAACIACLNDSEKDPLPFPRAIADYIGKYASNTGDSFEKRFASLLDTRWDNDGFFAVKLSRLVKILIKKGYAIDPVQLLNSLEGWNNTSRKIQKEWAKMFVSSMHKED